MMHDVHGSVTRADSISSIIREARQKMSKNPDSARMLLEEAYLMSLDPRNDSLQMKVLQQFSFFYQSTSNHYLTIDYAFKALDILEKTDLQDMSPKQLCLIIELNSRIGYSYYYLNAKEMARKYITRVVGIVDSIESINASVCSEEIVAYSLNNLSGIFLDFNDLDEASRIFKRIEDMHVILKDSLLETSLNVNKGVYYKNRGDFDSAMIACNKALGLAERISDKSMMARIHNNMADIHQHKGDTAAAKKHFILARDLAEEVSSWSSVSIAAKELSDIYAASGDYKSAYENNSLLMHLNDSVFSPAKNERFAQMALQYEFDKALRQHQADLTARWKDQRNKKQTYRFLVVILSLIVVIGVIILISQRRKTKLTQLENDYAILRAHKLEQDKLAVESELENNKRHLMERAMWLVQKNEMIARLADQLIKIKNDIPDKYNQSLNSAISQLNGDTSENLQREFEIRFGEVNQDFINTLNKKFPDLSPAEKKLASFLSLNLSTKEIAAITFQNPASLKVARSRLRSKLGLKKGENLVKFLINLK